MPTMDAAEQRHRRDLATGGFGHAAHDPVGHEVEGDQRDHRGDREAAIQRVHDLAALARLHEVAADDGRDDRHAAQHERIHDGRVAHRREGQRTDEHRRDDRDGVGLEQVGGHAGAVADVVTDVVGDHGGVARIVFRDPGFDLAHEVGADVRTLREDAATQTREDRDQRGAEGQAHHRVEQFGQVGRVAGRLEHAVVAGHAEHPQAHDQHAGDGAAAERDVERLVQADGRRLRRAHVRAHRDVHADEAGSARQDGADREADRGGSRCKSGPVARRSGRDCARLRTGAGVPATARTAEALL
jgi:hypothetical protein